MLPSGFENDKCLMIYDLLTELARGVLSGREAGSTPAKSLYTGEILPPVFIAAFEYGGK